MVEDLGAADGGGRRGFQAELRPRKAEESVPALLADTKEIQAGYFLHCKRREAVLGDAGGAVARAADEA